MLISLVILYPCSLTFGQTGQVNIPTTEQVQKMVTAAWKEPIENIDILYYEYYTGVPESIEQIHKRAEETVDHLYQGRSIDKLEPYEKEMRNKTIEANVEHWIKDQAFPRKKREHVWISGDKQRIDSVDIGPNELLEEDTPFDHSYINTKDAITGDSVSYHYAREMNTVFVNQKKWKKKTIVQFAGIPVAKIFQKCLGSNQDNGILLDRYIPDQSKIEELAKTGLVVMGNVREGEKENKSVNRINIYSDPNAPNSRDILNIGAPDYFPDAVLICDRNDYSRVYRLEFHIPTTNQILYIRECNDFDSNDYPHNVIEINYDAKGKFKNKSIYSVINAKLNPSIPSEIFEIHPPQGCKTVDERPKK